VGALVTPERGPSLSIVVPCLNEAATIAAMLESLAPLRSRGAQVIVVDGGSTDDTVALASARADVVVRAPTGRAVQMNAGAARATGDVVLFLHADTVLPQNADESIREALARQDAHWGRFDVDICGDGTLFRVISAAMNLRSRVSGIATGDQAIFVKRAAFEAVGGYPPIALMEDVALSKRLNARCRPACIRERVRTSARRWEKHGVLHTILLMWRLRLAYRLGADPDKLALRYVAHK
jgi:rSAM/selenodomain-associated transferase 2